MDAEETNVMDRYPRENSSRWLTLRVTMCGLLLLTVAGCKQFIILSYLIGGPPSIEPLYDKQTGRQLTEYGKLVAVVCYADNEMKWDFDQIDYQIAGAVSQRLAMHKIDVIKPVRVRAWLDQNQDWERAQEIGAGLTSVDGRKPTHVIYIDLRNYSLYEPDSHNLYRGRAEARISVFEMDEDGEDGREVFEHDIKSRYPIHATVATDEVSFTDFRGRYLARLSEEIGRLFYEHYAGDDIPDGA